MISSSFVSTTIDLRPCRPGPGSGRRGGRRAGRPPGPGVLQPGHPRPHGHRRGRLCVPFEAESWRCWANWWLSCWVVDCLRFLFEFWVTEFREIGRAGKFTIFEKYTDGFRERQSQSHGCDSDCRFLWCWVDPWQLRLCLLIGNKALYESQEFGMWPPATHQLCIWGLVQTCKPGDFEFYDAIENIYINLWCLNMLDAYSFVCFMSHFRQVLGESFPELEQSNDEVVKALILRSCACCWCFLYFFVVSIFLFRTGELLFELKGVVIRNSSSPSSWTCSGPWLCHMSRSLAQCHFACGLMAVLWQEMKVKLSRLTTSRMESSVCHKLCSLPRGETVLKGHVNVQKVSHGEASENFAFADWSIWNSCQSQTSAGWPRATCPLAMWTASPIMC